MKNTVLTPSDATKAKIFRLIVAGGRTFANKPLCYYWLDQYLSAKIDEGFTIEIVHGNCFRQQLDSKEDLPTADQLARFYAYERGYEQTPFDAAWKKWGKRAGPLRNTEMGDYGHALVAFWNRKSPGTKNMITLAKRKGLPVRIVYCKY